MELNGFSVCSYIVKPLDGCKKSFKAENFLHDLCKFSKITNGKYICSVSHNSSLAEFKIT